MSAPRVRFLSRAALAPGAVLFAILFAYALLETGRDALFLARLGAQQLAIAYVAMAGCALVAVAVVRRARLRDPRRMLIAFLVVGAIGTAALAATVAGSRPVVFALYLWTGFVATLVVPSFWTAIDRSVKIGEAKRAFGAIGAGGVAGSLCGSALASALGRLVAARYLVTAAALGFGVALVVAIALMPKNGVPEPVVRRPRAEALSRRSRRYVRLLLAVGVASTVVLTLGDLTFKRVIANRFAAGDLASAFGAIYTALNAISLAVQLLVTPRLLERWGVAATLVILPVIMIATALGFALTGATIAVIALKLGDGGLRYSVHRVGCEVLYLPLPAAIRNGWKVIADALGQRGGQALAATIALGLGAFDATSRELALVTAIGGAVWLASIAIVRRGYVAQFRDMLQAGEIRRDAEVPPLDASAYAMLTHSLASDDEVEVRAALDLLARHERIPESVLLDPRPSVVRHALELFDGDMPARAVRVLAQLHHHDDPHVRAAALAAATRDGRRVSLFAARDDPAPEVRAVALVRLAALGHRDADPGVAALIAGTTAERIALADAIGYAPSPRLHEALHALLATGEADVQRRALHVLSRAPVTAELGHVVGLLADPRLREDARRVFVAAGQRGLDVLTAALDDPATPPVVRRHLPRSISPFGSERAAAALAARLVREPDRRIAYKLLRALGRMRADQPHLALDPEPLREYLRHEVREAARYAVLRDDFAAARERPSRSRTLIGELLLEKHRASVEHVFRALGILFPEAGLRSAHDALTSSDPARHAAAREIVESIAPADIRGALLAVMDGGADRREQLGALAPGPYRDHEALLAALLADASESLRCVVAYHVAERHLVALRGDLARLRPPDGSPLLIDAFDQAIARLDA